MQENKKKYIFLLLTEDNFDKGINGISDFAHSNRPRMINDHLF